MHTYTLVQAGNAIANAPAEYMVGCIFVPLCESYDLCKFAQTRLATISTLLSPCLISRSLFLIFCYFICFTESSVVCVLLLSLWLDDSQLAW
jgi:hypothetical protein